MNKIKINVLIAPNSMKGSMSAIEFANVVEEAFLKVSSDFSIRKVPIADGGDFTGEILRTAFNARKVDTKVKNPLGKTVLSKFAVAGKRAVIEMADASGIKLLNKDELNPLVTSSYGTGQLINEAIQRGCTEILLGVGGSATVDGGSGMMQALGFSYYDKGGNLLDGNGGNLEKISSISKPALPLSVAFKIISDVDNPLLGPEGAASVFGPQKGATPQQVQQLEEGLTSWCHLLEKESGKNLGNLKGAGAGGGMALPLLSWFDAEIVPGARYILNILDFDKHVQWADIIITGEGKLDRQTLNNKAPKAVADVARKEAKPVIAIGGTVEPEVSGIFSGGAYSFLCGPVSLEHAMNSARSYLSFFSSELAKTILSFMKK